MNDEQVKTNKDGPFAASLHSSFIVHHSSFSSYAASGTAIATVIGCEVGPT